MSKVKERLRGVRASRTKLNKALSQSDLSKKTQAAVAEKIADNEGLDTLPKDLVNRVFRELSVDPQSIERVASVLGVEAHSLYKTDARSTENDSLAQRKPVSTLTKLLSFSVVVLLLMGFFIYLNQDSRLACQMQSLWQPAMVADDKLGIYVARFANDSTKESQQLIARLFVQDETIAPALTVVMGCQEFSSLRAGDYQQMLATTRSEVQNQLRKVGAHVALWGTRFDNNVKIYFTSNLPDTASHRLSDGNGSMEVREQYVELDLDLSDPASAGAQLKKLALSLMHIENKVQLLHRDEILQKFVTSFDWLRRSILADQNLRTSLDPKLDQQQWAIVSAQLCYKYRLLGDYSGKPNLYHQAVEACESTLQLRSREKYPLDWSATKTNLASAQMRLAMYDNNAEKALSRLEQSAESLRDAALEVDPSIAPQLWSSNRRNLGSVHLRMAELSAGPDYLVHYHKAVELLEQSLSVLDPSFQPHDWANTNQNLCVVKYQYGIREDTGADNKAKIENVREGITHCEEAIGWLSPDTSGAIWARVQNNLAASNAVLAELTGDDTRLIQARTAFLHAQEIYTRDAFPLNWAEVEANLGQLHCSMARLAEDKDMLDKASEHTENALGMFLKKGHRYSTLMQSLLDGIVHCRLNTWADCRCESQ